MARRIASRLAALLILPALVAPLHHASAAVRRPRLFIIICDALTVDNLADSRYPFLTKMVKEGACGLLNCAVAGKRTPTSALLTIAAGQQVAALPSDEDSANDWELVAGEKGFTREAWVRRCGILDRTVSISKFDSQRSVKMLGMANLMRGGLSESRLGPALLRADPPAYAYVCGNADTATWQRRSALLTTGAAGVGAGLVAQWQYAADRPYGFCDDPAALADYAVATDADVVVVQLGDTARAEMARRTMPEDRYHFERYRAVQEAGTLLSFLAKRTAGSNRPTDFLLLSPYPPSGSRPSADTWDRLTPIVGYGPDFPPGLFTSPTTRTAGLIANIDIAPTVLKLFGAPAPAAFVGRAATVVGGAGGPGLARLRFLQSADYLAALNSRAQFWPMAVLGAMCFAGVMASILERRRGSSSGAAPFAVITLSLALASLIAPILPPPTLYEYTARIGGLMALLTAVAYAVGRRLRLTPPVAASGLLLGVVAADLLTGERLLRNSPISAYPISGIRYYGIGNEYLGIVLAMLFVGSFALIDDLERRDGSAGARLRRALPWIWALAAVAIGWPRLGANLGSLPVTMSGLAAGTAILRGRRQGRSTLVIGIVAGLAAALLFAWLDSRLGAGASHAGYALSAASGGRGAGYLMDIAVRKVLMNLRLMVTPVLILPAVIVAITIAAACRWLSEPIRTAARKCPYTAAGLRTLLPMAIAALLFKDSGVVTVTFMLGTACAATLWYVVSMPADEPPGSPAADPVPIVAAGHLVK